MATTWIFDPFINNLVPSSSVPNVFIYQGTWNPTTNTPTLVDGTGTTGYVYWVSVAYAGPIAGLNNASMVNFQIGDLVLYNGSQWQLTTPAAGVTSVNGAQGAVVVNAINQLTGDVTTSAASESESEASTVAKIQGTVVSGTTGSGNVVFSTSPTLVTPAIGAATGASLSVTGQLTSTVATGTAPLVVASTTQVANLYATTAVNVTGIVALVNGGTGQTTAQAAINSLAGAVTSGEYLRGNGTNVVMSTIQVSDVPTLNQNTTGTAANITATSNSTLTTLSALTTALSLSSVGTITSGTWNGSTLGVGYGGTGITTTPTNGQVLIGNGSTYTAATITAGTGIAITNGVGTITISNSLSDSGDLPDTSFSLANNRSSAANVTGFAFANASVGTFQALVLVYINATSPLYESFTLQGVQKASTWNMSATSVGDSSGVTFSITATGQIQYTSSNYTGFSAGTCRFRAITLGL